MPVDEKSALEKALREALETLSFLDSGETDSGPSLEEVSHILQIDLVKPRRGLLSLFLPKALKLLIAENTYGLPIDQLSAQQIDDCLLELLNVVAGRFLVLLYGNEAIIHLGLPRLVYDVPDDRSQQPGLVLDVEGLRLKALVEWE